MSICILFFTVFHTKLGLFSHRPDLPPVTTLEHSLPEASSSKEMLSNVKLSTQWCSLPHGNTHLSSKSQSYRKKCLRKQALSQKTKKDLYKIPYGWQRSVGREHNAHHCTLPLLLEIVKIYQWTQLRTVTAITVNLLLTLNRFLFEE